MEILIRLDRFDELPPEGNHRNRSEALFKTVTNIYYDSSSGSESYLHDEINDEDCIFGDEQPQALILSAETWNAKIREDARQALEKLELARRDNDGEYPLDTLDTYYAKKALFALDNCFYVYAEYATCLGYEQDYFKASVQEDELEDIQVHPERYALIEVYPK